MKKYKILILLFIVASLSSCDRELLDISSLTEPVDATFYSNEQELDLALTGVYSTLQYTLKYELPIGVVLDNTATDIAIARGFEGTGGFSEFGTGNHSATSSIFKSNYSYHYKAIESANALLQYMERAKDVTDEETYAQIEAQALAIRAYHYMYLTELYGDVPLVLEVFAGVEDALVSRTSKSEIVDQILNDLDKAADVLPNSWGISDKTRITKGAALALRARIALYNEKYDIAASSAKEVIDNASAMGYQLYPNYADLFDLEGEGCDEVILGMPYQDGFKTSWFTRSQGSRNLSGYSTTVPTQSMIDSYEAIDGKPIDESDVYDPKKPFENRDPRLAASIILPGTIWAGQKFESHPDSTKLRDASGAIIGNNNNCRNVIWAATFTGYMWRKYTVEDYQAIKQIWSDLDFMLIRYAEVLLTYAEARIEQGQIDNSVLNALNQVRARAYGVDVSDVTNYPAVTTTNQSELRKLIRRERKVELADEGFRFFDIRRWRIAEKVMPVTIYGRILNPETATGVPQIDDDCFVSYEGVESQYDLNTDSRFPNALNRKFDASKDYLCPIPQQEIDTYKGMGVVLEQNPGY